MLDAIRPAHSRTAHLFVGTERFQYFTLAWNNDTQSLETIQTAVDATEKHMRDSQSLDRCSVDPTGQHIVMELYEAVLSIMRIQRPKKGTQNYLAYPEQVRISEKFILSSTFLRTSTNVPKFAILYSDGRENPNIRLSTYRLTNEKGTEILNFDAAKDRENDLGDLDPGARLLIPVPESAAEHKRYLVRNAAAKRAQLGGVLVVGESMMLYLDDESGAIVEYAYEDAAIFVAWAQYDETRFLLGDDYGNLHMLELVLDAADVVDMEMRVLIKCSKASQMVFLGNGLLYIGSHEADSQVIHVDLDNKVCEVIQTLMNIAPIMDFTIMDMGNRDGDTTANEYSSGQARIVTGSGSFQSGSLRSVRSGVGLEDIGLLGEMPNIRAMFSLKGSAPYEFVDTLVISCITETRVLVFDNEGNPEEKTSHLGLDLSNATLLASNIGEKHILQATPTSVTLLEDGMAVSSWRAPEGMAITSLSANQYYVLLCVEGSALVSLDIAAGLQEIARQDLGDRDQVACVHVPEGNKEIGLAGFWGSGSVSILQIATLDSIHTEPLRLTQDSAAIPRDIVMAQILPPSISGPTLLVSLSDGIVQTFSVSSTDYSLSGKKSVVLGTQQPRFKVLPQDDDVVNVFATCEHASLIYGAEGRLVYSAVTAEDATCICPFDTPAYPDAIVLATVSDLRISAIDNEKRTHVNTLPINELVRRIAYSPTEKLFGLGTIKQSLERGVEHVVSSFRLVDEVIFQELGKPFMLDDYPGVEMVEAIARATLPDSYGQPAERFIVGTHFLEEEGIEIRGRLLVFGVDSERSPYLIASKELKGACRCVTVLDGKIVSTLTKTVAIWDYNETTSSSGTLTKLATFRSSTLPIDLAVTEDGIIAVADIMQSISLIAYEKGEGGLADKLVEVARHFESCWSTAVAHIEGDNFLQADADGNIVVLKRNRDGITLEDRQRLQVTSELNLGEQVNRIQRINNIEASERAPVIPRAFLATVSPYTSLLHGISD